MIEIARNVEGALANFANSSTNLYFGKEGLDTSICESARGLQRGPNYGLAGLLLGILLNVRLLSIDCHITTYFFLSLQVFGYPHVETRLVARSWKRRWLLATAAISTDSD